MNNQLLSYVLLLIANAFFALWDIFVREIFSLSKHPFNPLLFLILRTVIVGTINTANAYRRHGFRVAKEEHGRFKFDDRRFLEWALFTPRRRQMLVVTTSLCGIFFTQTGYLYGVKFTSATHGAVLQPSIAVVAMVLAVFLGAETLGSGEEKKNKLIGLVLSVGGAVVIVLGSGHHTPSKGALHVPKAYPIMGTSFLLIEVVAMAFFYILLPVLSRFYHSEWVTAWLFWAALPCYIFIFVLLLEIEPINSNQFIFDRLFFASLAYCAFQTVFYYNSIVFSSQHISGSMASLFACSHPVVTAFLSVLILGRPATMFDACGGVLICIGFYQSIKLKLKAESKKFKGGDASKNQFKPFRDQDSDDEIGELGDSSSDDQRYSSSDDSYGL